MKPYSQDLKERVLADSYAGMPTKQVAAKYQVCPAWVRRLKQRRRGTGSIAPRAQRHGPLAPLLAASRWLRLGKGTVMGLGQLCITPL